MQPASPSEARMGRYACKAARRLALQPGATAAFRFKQADKGALVDVTRPCGTSIEARLGEDA